MAQEIALKPSEQGDKHERQMVIVCNRSLFNKYGWMAFVCYFENSKGTSMTDQQKVWEALRAIYGMDLTAATLVVLTKDGENAVKFQTIYFPQQETEK